MRYITDSNNYVKQLSFGADIECDGLTCTEYTGAVPAGYTSLADWYIKEADSLYRWKIVNGNLTLDSSAAAPVNYQVKDYIIETGSDDDWNWEKWASGKLELWNKAKCSGTGEAQGESPLGYDFYLTVPLPVSCITIACVTGFAAPAGNWGVLSGWTKMGVKSLRLHTSGKSNTTTIGYSVRVTGTWK